MTKYKVRCGTLRETVQADSANEAARKALEAADSRPGRIVLSDYFEVKPWGKPAVYRRTENVLRDCGRLAEIDGHQ